MLAVALELKQWLFCFRNPQMFAGMHLSQHSFTPSHYFLRLFQLTVIANYYVQSIVRDVWPTVTLVRHFNRSSPFPYRMHCFDISVVLHQPARPTVPVLCFCMYILCNILWPEVMLCSVTFRQVICMQLLRPRSIHALAQANPTMSCIRLVLL